MKKDKQQPLFTKQERIEAICKECSDYQGNNVCGAKTDTITVSISGNILKCPKDKWWFL